jgi:hypothetical protein
MSAISSATTEEFARLKIGGGVRIELGIRTGGRGPTSNMVVMSAERLEASVVTLCVLATRKSSDTNHGAKRFRMS